MRSKVMAAVVAVVALTSTAAGVASATSRSSASTAGVEHYWLGNFSRTTGDFTLFVGTGLFTDAGSISSYGRITLSKGSFLIDLSKAHGTFTVSAACFFQGTGSGTIRLFGGTGAYAGISATLPFGGKIVGVVPRLANGKCNQANSVVPLALVGAFSGSGKVSLAPPVPPPTTTTTPPSSKCIVPSCVTGFPAPDDFDATSLAIGGVLQNVPCPDPGVCDQPAGDQIDEVVLAMGTGSTGMSYPGSEVLNFALALAGGGQGVLDSITFDRSVSTAMGSLGPVGPNHSFGAALYFDVPISTNWSSVNFSYTSGVTSKVYVFYK